jgi:hypothetical protein
MSLGPRPISRYRQSQRGDKEWQDLIDKGRKQSNTIIYIGSLSKQRLEDQAHSGVHSDSKEQTSTERSRLKQQFKMRDEIITKLLLHG